MQAISSCLFCFLLKRVANACTPINIFFDGQPASAWTTQWLETHQHQRPFPVFRELTPMWMLTMLRWCIVQTVPQFQRINSLLSLLILLSRADFKQLVWLSNSSISWFWMQFKMWSSSFLLSVSQGHPPYPELVCCITEMLMVISFWITLYYKHPRLKTFSVPTPKKSYLCLHLYLFECDIIISNLYLIVMS